MKQVPYWETSNIRRHRTKFSRHGDLSLGIGAALWSMIMIMVVVVMVRLMMMVMIGACCGNGSDSDETEEQDDWFTYWSVSDKCDVTLQSSSCYYLYQSWQASKQKIVTQPGVKYTLLSCSCTGNMYEVEFSLHSSMMHAPPFLHITPVRLHGRRWQHPPSVCSTLTPINPASYKQFVYISFSSYSFL